MEKVFQMTCSFFFIFIFNIELQLWKNGEFLRSLCPFDTVKSAVGNCSEIGGERLWKTFGFQEVIESLSLS